MYSRMYPRFTVMLLGALLVACGTPARGEAPRTTTSRALSATLTVPSEKAKPATVTSVASHMSDATPTPVPPSLPAGWRYVAWQGLSVPLPPEATGILSAPDSVSTQTHEVPVLAAGVVGFPPPPTPTGGAIGEDPFPPTLILLQFPGTLDEWIALEEKSIASAEGGVMEPVEQLTIAGREAVHYQRTVPGFNYNDYYAVKLTDTTLLWI